MEQTSVGLPRRLSNVWTSVETRLLSGTQRKIHKTGCSEIDQRRSLPSWFVQVCFELRTRAGEFALRIVDSPVHLDPTLENWKYEVDGRPNVLKLRIGFDKLEPEPYGQRSLPNHPCTLAARRVAAERVIRAVSVSQEQASRIGSQVFEISGMDGTQQTLQVPLDAPRDVRIVDDLKRVVGFDELVAARAVWPFGNVATVFHLVDQRLIRQQIHGKVKPPLCDVVALFGRSELGKHRLVVTQ